MEFYEVPKESGKIIAMKEWRGILVLVCENGVCFFDKENGKIEKLTAPRPADTGRKKKGN